MAGLRLQSSSGAWDRIPPLRQKGNFFLRRLWLPWPSKELSLGCNSTGFAKMLRGWLAFILEGGRGGIWARNGRPTSVVWPSWSKGAGFRLRPLWRRGFEIPLLPAVVLTKAGRPRRVLEKSLKIM